MSMVLVDTSVWRHFFAGRSSAADKAALEALLDEDGALLLHVAVIGELVLGGVSSRQEALLSSLPQAPSVADGEVMLFIRHRKLERRGIGWVDAELLASALVAGAELWSVDRALSAVADELGVAFVRD